LNRFDIIVVGGGHAGCEAAAAAAGMGLRAALVTPGTSALGRMSCNPAVGGLAKGHIVREIDALGGVMGRVADRAGIQFRVLNRSKGPAVRAPRAQVDRNAYEREMGALLRGLPGLTLVAGLVEDLLMTGGRVAGVRLATGRELDAPSVVLTTGTFLRGRIHVGLRQEEAGRLGEAPAVALAEQLEAMGFRMGRLKTGTPPRLDGTTIDYGRLRAQPGDADPIFFHAGTVAPVLEQRPCHLAYTNERVHEQIRMGLDRSPLYSGVITSTGPRYCPSIEDKVVRFTERNRHQLFLEPEGLDTDLVYINGLSTSLPAEIQERMLRCIDGLEQVSGAGAHGARRLRHRVRLRGSHRAGHDAPGPPPAGPVPGRADQRHHRLRGGRGPGIRGRAGRRSGSAAIRPTSACWWTTWSPGGRWSRTACSPRGPSTG